MKALEEHSDEHLNERYQSLGRSLFLAKGKLYYPSHARPLFDAARLEIIRRGLDLRLMVEDWIRPDDPMPTFHTAAIIRYAKIPRLVDLKEGRVSFAPAPIYKEQTNIAQRDDEMSRHWHMSNTNLPIKGVEYPASNLVHRRQLKSPEDGGTTYHLLSFSIEESPKLQRAFDADGYIVVLSPDKFYDTILSALRQKLGETSGGIEFRGVKYYDDLEEPIFEKPNDILFFKPIHFQYQNEARLAVYGAPNQRERFNLQVSWPEGIFSEIRQF
jgi:hypothetical protein